MNFCRSYFSFFFLCIFYDRLRVVSNFGDGDCGGAKYTRARESSRRCDAKGAPKIRDYRQSQGF